MIKPNACELAAGRTWAAPAEGGQEFRWWRGLSMRPVLDGVCSRSPPGGRPETAKKEPCRISHWMVWVPSPRLEVLVAGTAAAAAARLRPLRSAEWMCRKNQARKTTPIAHEQPHGRYRPPSGSPTRVPDGEVRAGKTRKAVPSWTCSRPEHQEEQPRGPTGPAPDDVEARAGNPTWPASVILTGEHGDPRPPPRICRPNEARPAQGAGDQAPRSAARRQRPGLPRR